MARTDLFLKSFLAHAPEQYSVLLLLLFSMLILARSTALRRLFKSRCSAQAAAVMFTSAVISRKTSPEVATYLYEVWYALVRVATAVIARQEEILDLLSAIGELPDYVVGKETAIRWSEYPRLNTVLKQFIFTYEWRYQESKEPLTRSVRKVSFAAKLFARQIANFDLLAEAMVDLASAFDRPSPIPTVSPSTSASNLSFISSLSSSSSESEFEPTSPSSTMSGTPPRYTRFDEEERQLLLVTDQRAAEQSEEIVRFRAALSVAGRWIFEAGSLVYNTRECVHAGREMKIEEEMNDYEASEEADSSDEAYGSVMEDSENNVSTDAPTIRWELSTRETEPIEQRSLAKSPTKANSATNRIGVTVVDADKDSSELSELEDVEEVEFSSVGGEENERPGDSEKSKGCSKQSDNSVKVKVEGSLDSWNSMGSDEDEGITARHRIKNYDVVYQSSWHGPPGFSKARWKSWKERCRRIEGMEELPEKTREGGRIIAEKMDEIEKAAERKPHVSWADGGGGNCFHF